MFLNMNNLKENEYKKATDVPKKQNKIPNKIMFSFNPIKIKLRPIITIAIGKIFLNNLILNRILREIERVWVPILKKLNK